MYIYIIYIYIALRKATGVVEKVGFLLHWTIVSHEQLCVLYIYILEHLTIDYLTMTIVSHDYSVT